MFGSKRGLGRAGAAVLVTALVAASLWAVTAVPAAATPGGTTGTDFWLRADRGTGTSSTGTPVQTWTDQAVPGNTVSQAAAASRPTYNVAGPNFNPSLRFFDGTTPRWFGSNIDTSYTAAGKGKYSFWAVAVPDATRSGFILSSDDNVPNGGSFDRWMSYNSGGVLQGASGQAYAPAGGITGGTAPGPKLIRIYYNQGVANGSSGWLAGVNGGSFTSTMDDTAGPLAIGALVTTGAAPFRGTIAEVIGVAGAPNDDASANARIQSYLAAKYGTTLGDVDNAPGGNSSVTSVNSAGTTYWSAPVAYQNNVTVIARDSVSDFDQRVSQASTTTTLPVTLAAGAYAFTGTITPTSPTTALTDLASVAIGDDNGSTAITTAATEGVTARMARVWRVQTAGSSPAQVSVRVPASGITLPTGARTLYAVSGASATFSAPVTTTALTLQNGYYVGTIPTPASGAFLTFGVRVADPEDSTIAAAPPTITADGVATSTVTVTLRDANGEPVLDGGDTVTIVKNAGEGTLGGVLDHGDGTYSVTLTSPTTAGTATLGFTVNGAPGTGTATVTFAPGAASATGSTIAAVSPTLTAGDSTLVTVTVRDVNGNALGSAGAGHAVVMTTDLGTISAPVTDNGDGTYTATLSSTLTGTATVGFTLDAAPATDTDTVVFTPGVPTAAASTIAAAPTSVTADGTSVSTVTVTLRDEYGNLTGTPGADVTMSVTAGVGTLAAVTDVGDGTYTATLSSAVAGTSTIGFELEDVAGTGTASVTFVPGAADVGTSTIVASPTSITANGASTSTITVTLRDANGNVVADAGEVVALSTTAGTLTAVTDNGDGTYTATLTSATTVGSATVSFTIDDADADATASVAFVAGAADVGTSTIVASPTSITADGASTSTVTVTLLDANGNVVADAGDVVDLATTAGTLSALTDNGDGTYTAVLTSAATVGTATVSFTIDDADADATASVAFVAGAADVGTSTIVASPTSITADGTSTSTVTVTLLDANGNVVADAGDVVDLATTAGTLSGVTDNGDGTYTATLTSATTVGSATVSFTIDDADADATAAVAFVAGAADVGTSTIVASPTSITADGTSTSTVTVTLLDANGNVVADAGDVVDLATTAGTLSGVTDNGDGTYSAVLTSTTTVGSATISFTIDGDDADGTASVAFVAGAADVGTSTIVASPTSITADGTSTSTVTVTLLDANGNVVADAGDVVDLATTAGTLSGVTDNGDGTYTATLTSATTVGSATVSFTIDDADADATAAVAFVAGAADVGTSTITASPTSITANGTSTSTVTVTLLDANGNVVADAGDAVDLATTAGTLSGVTDNGDGTYTATLTSATTVGSATISFTIDGDDATATATVAFVAGSADVGTSTIAASPTSITADGTSTSTVTVTLRDAEGNLVVDAGDVVDLASTAGTLSALTDNGDGTYTGTLTSATTVGSATVSFTIDGDDATATATVAFVAGAADVGTSTIAASPTSITADGTSTSTVTVTLLDANGNVVADAGDVVDLATTAGTLSALTDNGDGTYTAVLTSATTVGSATVSFTIDDADADATAAVAFVAGAADVGTSTIVASPTSITANGTSTSTVTVTLRDANGNVVADAGDVVDLATTADTLSGVTDNGDGTYTGTLTSATAVGSATVSFTIDGDDADATATVAFVAGAADVGTSTITASPASITADGTSTSTVTVTLLDAEGNVVADAGDVVDLATTAGTLSAVTDNGDGTYTATLTSATTVGSATISFTIDDADADATAAVAFVAGGGDVGTSTIVASPTSITANGTSTSTITVTLLDANGNVVADAGDVVDLATTAGTLSGVTDNGDGTYTATLTSATTAGSATVSFTIDDADADGTASVAFVAGAADVGTSTILASPTSITADGTSTSTITVTLLDTNGNVVVAAGDVVALSSTAGTLSGVTNNGDGTYTATLTSATTAGTATVSFAIDDADADATATVSFVAGAADVGTSTIVASPTSITADGSTTSTITVSLLDASGNVVADAGDVVALSTTAGTLSAVTDNGDGTYSAVLTSATTVGSATVSFTIDDEDADATATVAFVAGAADVGTSTITASPTSITANGTSTSTITVTLLDANGNVVADAGDAVGLSTTAGTLSAATDNGDGTYTAVLTSATTAGSATISFTIAGVPADDTAAVQFTAGSASPATSTIAADPPSITADGTSTSTITVTARDAQGNPVTTGAVIAITSSAGTVGATVDNGDGTWSATLTSSTAAGSATVGFTVDGDTSPNVAIVAFTAGAADATASTISASPTSITADGASTSTITVALLDANGNPLTASGGTVTMATDAGTLGSVTDNADGTYTAVLTSATAVGTAVVGFTVAGDSSPNTATVTFTAGPADPSTSTITASPAIIPADGSSTSTITVTLLDANGNLTGASGGTVAMTPDVGTVGAVTDNGDGTYTAIYTSPTSTTPPAAIIEFSLNGTTGTQTATVAFVAGVPSTTTSEIAASPATITADGASTSTVTVALRDGNGNPVPDAGPIVGMTTTAGVLSGVTDNGDGTYTATLTSATLAGTATVSFTIDGAGASDTAAVAFVAGAPDPGTSTIAAAPTSITADGVSTSAVTVTLFDAQGNRVPSGGVAVIIQTDAGTIGAPVDNGDGSYTATLVSADTVGTATLSFTVAGTAGSATASVEFTVGEADPGTSTITAAPSTIENDGVAASTITVQLLDASGNALGVGGDTVALTTTLGTLSAVVDNGDGTYTASLTSTTSGVATIGFLVNGVTATATALVTAVDTVAPAAPVITGPTDGATVPGTPVISGGGEPGATVTVVDGDGDEVCSAVVAGDGTWTCFPSAPLPEGETELIATQTDPSGNTSPESDPVDITVDRTPPPPPVLAPTDGETIDGTSEPGSTVVISDTGGNVLCTAVADSNGDFSCTPATPIPPGTVVVAVATDDAGNTSDPASVRVGGPSIELQRDVASAGDTQVAIGRGFLPGERVSGLLTSTPVDLGTLTADEMGTVTFTFVLPADIEPGTHRVTLTGELSGEVWAEFEVPAPPAPPAPSGLSTTGGRALAGPAGFAAVLMLVGSMLLVGARRRSDRVLRGE